MTTIAEDDTTTGTTCRYPLAPSLAELVLLGVADFLVAREGDHRSLECAAALEHAACAIGHLRRTIKHFAATRSQAHPEDMH